MKTDTNKHTNRQKLMSCYMPGQWSNLEGMGPMMGREHGGAAAGHH